MITTRFDHREQILYIQNEGHISIGELISTFDDFILSHNISNTLRIIEFANAELDKTSNYALNIFSTENAARHWLSEN